MKKYVFRKGAQVPKGLSAQVVGEELQKLHDGPGLNAKAVVEIAKPVDSPLHPAFEWRDNVAGMRWREHQGRNLIRCVHVVGNDEQDTTEGFVHVRNGKDSAYHTMEAIVRSPDLFAIAYSEAEKRYRSMHNALDQMRRAAEESDDEDRLSRIMIAISAAEALGEAVRAIH